MRHVRRFLSRLREEGSRGRLDRELREDLEAQVAMIAGEHERRGLTPVDARRAALIEIGGLDQTRELAHGARGFAVFDNLQRDVRHALRVLRKTPAFSIVAIATLALGIGANAAIFSFIDAVVIRPLPYPEADALVSIWEFEGRRAERGAVAPANLPDYRRVSAFDDVAGFANASVSLTGDGTPEGHVGEQITHNYFSVLRVQPALGRAFAPEDDTATARKVVIISDALWHRRYAADPAILGKTVQIDGVAHEVVGVMPPGFRGLTDYGVRDGRHLWLPAAIPASVMNNRGEHLIRAVGRLRGGATVQGARAELAAVSDGLAKAYPQTNKDIRAQMAPLRDDMVRDVRTSFVVLMLTVGLILAIACVNVANLLIARGVGRRREIAVRYALGATRTRVYTSLITESVVLSLLACGAGLALAVWMKGLLLGAAPAFIPRITEVALDGRVLAFTIAVSVITGIVFGILPAWQAGQASPVDAMALGGRVVAGRRVMRWRNGLMIVQLALSALMLVGAGLMLKSLVRLNSVELGFDTRGVLAARTTLPPAKYPNGDARLAFMESVAERLRAVPGVTRVAFTNTLPLRGGWTSGFQIEGVAPPPGGDFNAGFQAASAGYFETLGIPVLRGRSILASDTKSSQPVAVVSEAFERTLLNGRSALGVRFSRGVPKNVFVTIVGVVRDVRRDGRAFEIEPQVYLPAAQTQMYPVRLADIAVRTSGDPLALAPAVRGAVWAVDPDQPVTAIRTLEDVMLTQGAERRFRTLLFAIFAAVALLLASIGTYGVIAYLVSQRTPEIGVRIALGAGRARIYRWLLGRTAVLVVAGTAAGLFAARLAGSWIATLLFEVEPGDAATYAAAAGLLLLVSLAASAIAVRRAARISPTVALRFE